MNTTSEMQLVPIDKLIPYVNNARTHSPEQLNKLRSSLREFGFINPVIIDRDFNVIAGHGRILAAKAENISEVPCVFVDYLTPAQKKAYIIADNRMALDAGWDEEMLKVEIEALQADDFDLGLTGFDEKELAAFFDDDSDTKDDDFDVDAEMEKPCMTKPGDLWLLGNHRLVCGDSTKPETYEVLMNRKLANLVVTDPPYNVRKAFADAGFYLSGTCIWKKQSLVLGRSPYQWQHEPCLFGWKKNGKHRWYSDRKQTTIWEFDKPKKNGDHPTMKPIPLIAYPIKNSSMSNCIVLDPFGGSGSTLIACEQTNRICHTIELDEKFCDVIVKRYIEQVGSAENVSVVRDGKTIAYSELEVTDEE